MATRGGGMMWKAARWAGRKAWPLIAWRLSKATRKFSEDVLRGKRRRPVPHRRERPA